jgi:hypothetical protein
LRVVDWCSIKGQSRDENRSGLHQHQQEVGDVDHLKVFVSEETAEKWFAENDPEGVAFMYDVMEWLFWCNRRSTRRNPLVSGWPDPIFDDGLSSNASGDRCDKCENQHPPKAPPVVGLWSEFLFAHPLARLQTVFMVGNKPSHADIFPYGIHSHPLKPDPVGGTYCHDIPLIPNGHIARISTCETIGMARDCRGNHEWFCRSV